MKQKECMLCTNLSNKLRNPSINDNKTAFKTGDNVPCHLLYLLKYLACFTYHTGIYTALILAAH